LLAFVCLIPESNLEIDRLRSFLKQKLPDHMVPSDFFFLDKLPMTSSGKIDRKNLPVSENNYRGRQIVQPTNRYEKKLMGLWQEILKINEISIYDNFFNIGGNSLLAINLTNLIVRDFEIEVNTTSIFEYPTIKDLSWYISSGFVNNAYQVGNEIDEKARRKKNVIFKKDRYKRN
jgi:acyl carrier protein